MFNAIAAPGRPARRLRYEVAELRVDGRTGRVDGGGEVHETMQNFRTARHDQLRIRNKPHAALRGFERIR